ncbi:MAG: DUF1599 domain-containing protein [Bacteroidetes bacterium]|nr:DUF1599 domain-containing protein [Bacteroidota bacterium]
MTKTNIQYDKAIAECRALFSKKYEDYGSAFRILRSSSVTDQIYIKVKRLVTLQTKTEQKVEDESEQDCFVAIVNYAIIGLIQLEKGTSESLYEKKEETLKLYDNFALQAKSLMQRKNHDYGEAWREMRITSITDLIFQKVLRTKEIENNNGKTLVSEGMDANYYDMLNYAVFCLIKIVEANL